MTTEINEHESSSIPYCRLWTNREFDLIDENELKELIKTHEKCEK